MPSFGKRKEIQNTGEKWGEHGKRLPRCKQMLRGMVRKGKENPGEDGVQQGKSVLSSYGGGLVLTEEGEVGKISKKEEKLFSEGESSRGGRIRQRGGRQTGGRGHPLNLANVAQSWL